LFSQLQTRSDKHPARPKAFTAVALVCLVLLALLAVAQVAHTHQEVSDADHCPLCIVMHSAAPVLAAVAIIALVEIAVAAPVLETRVISRKWHEELFIRPPPIAC
jgi:hypothetical protein